MSALGCSWQGDTSYLCWDRTWLQPDQVSSTSPPFLGSSWSVCPSSRASPSPKQLYFKNEAEPLRANYRSGDGTAAQSRAPLGRAHTQGHQQHQNTQAPSGSYRTTRPLSCFSCQPIPWILHRAKTQQSEQRLISEQPSTSPAPSIKHDPADAFSLHLAWKSSAKHFSIAAIEKKNIIIIIIIICKGAEIKSNHRFTFWELPWEHEKVLSEGR